MFDWVNKAIMGLLLSALVSCGGYAGYLRGEVSDLTQTVSNRDDTIGKDKLIIDRYVSNAKDTNAVIASIKASLEEAKKMQEKKAHEIAEAIAATESLVKEHQSYSSYLLATIPKSSNMCIEADDMINSYLAKERGGK